jgi:hypothetical protein
MLDFPHWRDAPLSLREDPIACGPLALWQVFRYFGIERSATEIVEACAFDPAIGTFTVGLALAAHEAGLHVELFSDVDPNPHVTERALYARAAAYGIAPVPSPSLLHLLDSLDDKRVAVLLYETPNTAIAHFTPVLGHFNGEVIAVNESDNLTTEQLNAGWQAREIFRQAVVVSRRAVT